MQICKKPMASKIFAVFRNIDRCYLVFLFIVTPRFVCMKISSSNNNGIARNIFNENFHKVERFELSISENVSLLFLPAPPSSFVIIIIVGSAPISSKL